MRSLRGLASFFGDAVGEVLKLVARGLEQLGHTEAAFCRTLDEAAEWLERTLRPGDWALTLGAGDRFSGALAWALARDWPWEPALALGNACAAAFVATGETADLEALDARLRGHL